MTRIQSEHTRGPSKVDQIRDFIRMQIIRGRLVAGDQLRPERELAKEFGASLLTVNKAMEGLEHELLLERYASRGTYVSPNVARGQVMVIFDIKHFVNPELSAFYCRLLDVLADTLKSRGLRAHHMLGRGKRGEEFTSSLEPKSAIWQHVSGVIAMAGLDEFNTRMERRGIPAVSFTTMPQLPGRGNFEIVMDNNYLIRQAYKHLQSRGCKKIGILINAPMQGMRILPESSGLTAYEPELFSQLATMGAGPSLEHIRNNCLTPRNGYDAMVDLWKQKNRPDGLIITNDNVAMGVGQAVVDLKIDPIRECKMITQATAGVPRDFPVNFTRCEFNLSRMCIAAVSLLYRLMARERDGHSVFMKSVIRQGETT